MSNDSVILAAALKRLHSVPVFTLGSTDRPSILGGQFAPTKLESFLKGWQSRWDTMPWRVWEYVHSIQFADNITDYEYLQRAEVFGEGGHLSLRRDGNRWLWHYIGSTEESAPEGFNQPGECEDFWESAQGKVSELHRYEERVLLWGEWKSEMATWWEDRVAAATLHYPGQPQGSSRVALSFWRYAEAGRTAFVWYRTLEALAGEEPHDA